LSLKARKLDGSEGFIIIVRDEPLNTRVQWNLGGWGNTKHGLQSVLGVQPSLHGQVAGSIEAGRWYDVRIELKGPRVDCYLDGALIQSAEIPIPQHGGFYASAVRDGDAGEAIIKLVNAASEPQEVSIQLSGVSQVKTGARALLLTSERLDDVNSFEQPRRVAPREMAIEVLSPRFQQTVPANAFMVLRVPVAL